MKRKHFQLIAICTMLCIFLSACWVIGPSVKGNGNVTEEVRQLDSFDRIEVSRGMNVYITQGSPAKVLVIADSNLHKVIKTKVSGGVLRVYADENIRWAEEKKVMVTIDKLSGVETTSGSNVWSQNQIKSENLELKSSSGSNQTLAVNAGFLSAQCSSGANIKLTGLAKEAELQTSSGANLKCPDLKADRCTMQASSGGNVSSTVVEKLDAKASSGGNIVYYGDPVSTEISKSSGGSINKK